MIPRRTVAAPARVEGVGLFTARPCSLTIDRAHPGAGLSFRVLNQRGETATIPATIAHLSTRPVHPAFEAIAPRNTSLALDPSDDKSPRAITTEHVLAALAGLGITDAIVDMTGTEAPIDDGSALAFVQAIESVGVVELEGTIEPIVIDREIAVQSGNATITASPSDSALYSYELSYPAGGVIGDQAASCDLTPEVFAREVAPARTFSFEPEARAMQSAGLFTHVSPRELLVIGSDGPIENNFRYDNEPARHKLLDLIGDLALVGRPIVGRIAASRSGHALNAELAKRLAETVAKERSTGD